MKEGNPNTLYGEHILFTLNPTFVTVCCSKENFSLLGKYLNVCNRKTSLVGVFYLLLEQSLWNMK